MKRIEKIALAVEYNGEGFCGWQRQPHCHSVQAELEQALAIVAGQPVTVHCAGRTDTGVHALAQIVHFEPPVQRPLRAWSFGVNSNMKRGVSVHWAQTMPEHFHARFSAISRSYRYTLLNRSTRPALNAGLVAWERIPLDVELMHSAAQQLKGEHDFDAFRSAECQAAHAVREIRSIAVHRQGNQVMLDVTANGFLHNMVRIITGCLLAIGRHDKPAHWLQELLLVRDRTQAGMTATAAGLCFLQPDYPPEFAVPDFLDVTREPWHP